MRLESPHEQRSSGASFQANVMGEPQTLYAVE